VGGAFVVVFVDLCLFWRHDILSAEFSQVLRVALDTGIEFADDSGVSGDNVTFLDDDDISRNLAAVSILAHQEVGLESTH
jgi:hypothetical protein